MDYRDDSGVVHRTGQHVFDYYSMEEVVIGPPVGSDGWFRSLRPDGLVSNAGMLNGQRICSLTHAEQMGWHTPPSLLPLVTPRPASGTANR